MICLGNRYTKNSLIKNVFRAIGVLLAVIVYCADFSQLHVMPLSLVQSFQT